MKVAPIFFLNITNVQAVGHCRLCLLQVTAKRRLCLFCYWGGGGFALKYLMQFYVQTLHNAMWICGLKLCGVHFELYTAGLVLWICGP